MKIQLQGPTKNPKERAEHRSVAKAFDIECFFNNFVKIIKIFLFFSKHYFWHFRCSLDEYILNRHFVELDRILSSFLWIGNKTQPEGGEGRPIAQNNQSTFSQVIYNCDPYTTEM